MFHVEQREGSYRKIKLNIFMTAKEVIASIRNVPDFPIKGIQFKDITTALAKPECLKWMRDEMVKRYRELGITQIVGIESRGFIVAPAVAIE